MQLMAEESKKILSGSTISDTCRPLPLPGEELPDPVFQEELALSGVSHI